MRANATRPDLGGVGDDDDAPGAGDEHAVRVGLDLVVRHEAPLRIDAVDAHHGQVEVHAFQGSLGEPSHQLVGLAARRAAGDDELQIGAQGELGGDVEGVGDDGESVAVGQAPGDLGGGGAAGEADASGRRRRRAAAAAAAMRRFSSRCRPPRYLSGSS